MTIPDFLAEAVERLRAASEMPFTEDQPYAMTLARAADLAALLDYVEGMKWRPIESAPFNEDVLVIWPRLKTDENDCPTDQIDGYVHLVSEQCSGSCGPYGSWQEPDWISGHGLHMDDDWCFALAPTHWLPLPPPPDRKG